MICPAQKIKIMPKDILKTPLRLKSFLNSQYQKRSQARSEFLIQESQDLPHH